MIISDLLHRKKAGGHVVTIAPADPVSDLVAALAEHNVGALVVTDGQGVLGIVSERDVVRRVASHGVGALETPVSDIMTTAVVTCSTSDDVESVAGTMTERRVRHMPVVDGETLAGIVSIGDVVAGRIAQLEHDRVQLEQYISG